MHTVKQRAVGAVPTPATGKATMFVDVADGTVKAKLPNGTTTGGASAGAGAGLTPIAWAQFSLGNGTEALVTQVGDVFTGINAIDVGEYELQLDPAAGLTDPTRLGVQISVRGTNGGGERFTSHLPSLPGNVINLYVFNAAGASVAAGAVTVTLWYAPEVEEAP